MITLHRSGVLSEFNSGPFTFSGLIAKRLSRNESLILMIIESKID